MWRVELPPGPDQLSEEAGRLYMGVSARVDRGEAPWGALPTAQQQEMNEVIRMWRGAAEQGDAHAQNNVGVMYHQGQGVKQDYAEAAQWWHKAA